MTIRTSIKRKFLFFSITLFLVLLIVGSIAFVVSMRQIVHSNKKNELQQTAVIERTKLEASVGGEIAIALKMADSPLIQRYFLAPNDPDLERIAFDEIAGYRRAFKGNTLFWVNNIDLRFFSDDAYAYTIDTSDPNSYWYLMTLNETETYNFNINYNPDLNVTNLWINAPVFDSSRKPIGILGTGIDLTAFINSIYQDFTDGASLYLFNSAGEITGARDTTLVADKAVIGEVLGSAGEEILSMAQNLSPSEFQSFSTPQGVIAVGTVPTLGWYIAVIAPLTLWDYLGTTMTVIFLAMMVIILVIFVVFFIFISGLLKPLNIMVSALDEISGNWDLTRRLDMKQKDETGNLAGFFNMTFERMSALIQSIKTKAFTLMDTSDELSSTTDETSQAIGKINENIQDMHKVVLTQTEGVTSTTASMEHILAGMDSLNNHVAVQVEAVAQSSSAVEQMLANISSVTETLKKNTANISSLAESSETGRKDLQKIAQDIQDIAKESEGLLEINSVMQNIASQTNLLAMNAAIEAAHAGESGRGFAVVADEIRKLAEDSGVQSKTISTVLKKIKTSIDTITKSTGIVLEHFSVIERKVNGVSDEEILIRNAMEEQGIGSRHILDAITRLNTVTGEVERNSAKMSKEAREVLEETGTLKHISGDVAEKMDDMTQKAHVITTAAVRVHEISRENKEYISQLSSEIARFKVE